jgi:hypothetical protein
VTRAHAPRQAEMSEEEVVRVSLEAAAARAKKVRDQRSNI